MHAISGHVQTEEEWIAESKTWRSDTREDIEMIRKNYHDDTPVTEEDIDENIQEQMENFLCEVKWNGMEWEEV
jgi:hypothetical protein